MSSLKDRKSWETLLINAIEPKVLDLRLSVTAEEAIQYYRAGSGPYWNRIERKSPTRALGTFKAPQIAVEDGAGVFEGLE